jgi:hypothetical protein
MRPIDERKAAFDAVKPLVMGMVPAMFHSYVTDAVILEFVNAALNAAEAVREKPGQ